MTVELTCPDEARRELVRGTGLNAIDFLEVLASQRTLLVHCLLPVTGVATENVAIEGGVRVRGIDVEWARRANALPAGSLRPDERERVEELGDDRDRVLVVRTSAAGDFSTYTLRLVESPTRTDEPPPGFDVILSSVDFSFKVDCPSEFDCARAPAGDEPPGVSPHIDYLAKDYASFKRLMLDRLALLVPDWEERNPADAMVALVELLAYSADSVSYFQDAAATEAYLGTARRRASIRRHARLIDYFMHDGASARAWIVLEVGENATAEELPRRTMVLTGELGAGTRLSAADVGGAVSRGALVFETLHALPLDPARNELRLYSWGDDSCYLPHGATTATLEPLRPVSLDAGDVLVIEEVLGPKEGRPEDADPSHRHAVRLVRPPRPRRDPATNTDLIDVEWHAEDALPFAVRLTTDDSRPACAVRANVVLADHGGTLLTSDGNPHLEDLGEPAEGRVFRPRLERPHVTQSVPYDDRAARNRAAADALRVDPRRALPAVEVFAEGERWEPERELLSSDRFASSFVVESEQDGHAYLRFGDGVLGRAPSPDVTFRASYRVGSGRAGNVGPGSLTRIATDIDVVSVTNPLPAAGGEDLEPLERVRLYAPQAFRTQKRAVTAADYATFAERHPQVQKAGATRRWTGSWYTVFVTVDRVGGREIDDRFEDDLRAFLDPVRLAGHDLEIDAPHFVALEIEMTVCVAADYVRSNVKAALLEAFSGTTAPSGVRGFFHPDNFTFGQPVYLSGVIATAMDVPGVEWVEVTTFQRLGELPKKVAGDELALGRLEIARLDNDPSRPENGRVDFEMKGGL
jgi:Baseplate J-like protein